MVERLLTRIRDSFRKPNGPPGHGSRPESAAVPAGAAAAPTSPRPARPAGPGGGEKRPAMERAAAPGPRLAPAQPAKWDPSLYQVAPREGFTRFHDLALPPEILHAIADLGFQYCTPIQAAILPETLRGADAAGRAQTGTGKTAAFLVSLFTHFLRQPPRPGRRPGAPRALILAPTRELALQIEAEARDIGRYCPFTVMAVFGGMDFGKQQDQLRGKVIDVMVATPGRLLDYHRRRVLHLNEVEVLVIDEADRMLDMGFIPDVRAIVHSTPPKAQRQTLLFSATLTSDVLRLTSQWTRDPVMVEIEPEHVAVESVEQVVYILRAGEKFTVLFNLLTRRCRQAVLIFTNRRDQARRLADRLKDHGIRCALLSGEVPQEKRLRTLDDFRSGRTPVVVATDVAGRGLHVEGIGHVVNYHLPQDPEDYVHRIGRTGRAGATGTSISFACEEESFAIPDIEKFLGHDLKCTHPEADLLVPPPPPAHRTPPPGMRPPPGRRPPERRGGDRGQRPRHGYRGGGRPAPSAGRPSA